METLLGNIELTEQIAKKLFSKLGDTNADLFICSNINVLPLTHLISSQIVNEYIYIPPFTKINDDIIKKIKDKNVIFVDETINTFYEIIELEKNLLIHNCKIEKILTLNLSKSIQYNKILFVNKI